MGGRDFGRKGKIWDNYRIMTTRSIEGDQTEELAQRASRASRPDELDPLAEWYDGWMDSREQASSVGLLTVLELMDSTE